MWSDPAYKYIYQTEWFDKKLTTFDRVNGKVYNTQVVGANPFFGSLNHLPGSSVISRMAAGRTPGRLMMTSSG